MPNHPSPWRKDFATVPASTCRVARYALQLVRNDPNLFDREVLGALWQLCLPLLEPAAVATFLTTSGERDLESQFAYEDDDEALQHPEQDRVQRGRLRRLFQRLPRSVLTRLAAADAAEPTAPAITLLGHSLGLDTTTLRLLDFLAEYDAQEPLRALLVKFGRATARANLTRLSTTLALPEPALRAALARQAPLRSLGLVAYSAAPSDLEDFVRPTDLLRELVDAAPTDAEVLLAILIEPVPPAVWSLAAFPHLPRAAAHLRAVLTGAAATAAVGVNALLHGAPGTGKTELARALAAACGLRAYQVRSADDDGDGLSRTGRLSAYLLAQRLLARRGDALLIFDEIEDVFDTGDDLFAFLRGQTAPGRQKGWMNRILEENPVPAIWITNSIEGMGPAFLRRFLLPVACMTPPRSVRRQMAECHLGDCTLPPTLLDELAADAALAPAHLGAARRLLTLCPDADPEATVRHGVAAMRSLLQGAPTPPRRRPAMDFDVAFLNLAGCIPPSAIVKALSAHGRGSLCFYGPPGTGKTGFADVLAEALDRELVVRRASDLISPYVGETEQNLARLFRESDPEHTLLLLDEVDSFLSDRRQAQHAWERTQVNELLQQMEHYPGIFIAATNLMEGIDAAALRRFDFKLHFRALTPAQRLTLFAREALGAETTPVPPDLARHLTALEALTPGDFATVSRQHILLGETFAPEQFLRRLVAECRLKRKDSRRVD